jgi:histidinol phosphatase-like PHP family hydrolase
MGINLSGELKHDKPKVSLHNHSFFSPDSKADPEEIIKEAIRQNLDVIGISDHCPLPFPYPYNGMKEADINDYLISLGRLKKTLGFQPGEAYCRAVIELLRLRKFDILGHLDLIKKFNKNEKYFSEKENWYQKLMDEAIDEIVRSKIIVEINTAGLDRPVKETYPSVWVIKELIQREIPYFFLLMSMRLH